MKDYDLQPKDLVVGNLYKGAWFAFITEDPRCDILLATDTCQSMVSIDCFVLLDKSQRPTPAKMTWKLTILTRNGELGWTFLSTGTHWFKELTNET